VTIDQFQVKLKDDFPKSSMGHVSDICEDVKWFTDAQRDEISTYLRKNHEYQSITYLKFRSHLKESGIRQKAQDRKDYAYQCNSCGQIYAGRLDWIDAIACPKCFCRESTVVTGANKTNVVTYQTMCLCGWGGYINRQEPKGLNHCPVWAETRRSYGPTCNKFGGQPTDEECRECSCRQCCQAYRAEKETVR